MRALLPLLSLAALLTGPVACGPPSPEDCAPDEVFAAQGCAPSGDAALVPEGCYVPCDADRGCPEGLQCVDAHVDPCFGDVCNACGGTQSLCVS